MKNLLLLLVFGFAATVNLSAQKVIEYKYDESGNRIHRGLRVEEQVVAQRVTGEEINNRLLETVNVKVSPNPTKGLLKVNIAATDADVVSVSLFSMKGILLKKVDNEKIVELDLSAYATGNYVLNVRVNENSRSWNVIKE